METAGYVAIRNDAVTDGRWKVGRKNTRIYARRDLSVCDRMKAARDLSEGSR